ncbi:MAG: hypothetical protein KIT57_19575 [Blastocatellales bacterium]|nr:hypothetical protein [Blastocatellales bacterium]
MKKARMKKALTHISLESANAGKLDELSPLAEEYLRVCQLYVDRLIGEGVRQPNKYADLPKIETMLSARWQRCAWQQACGMVQSWFSNGRKNPPVLKQINIQGNANVIKLEQSKKSGYDYWLRVSTLVKGKPVYLPVKLHKYAKAMIKQWEKLSTGIRLNRQGKRWYATSPSRNRNARRRESIASSVDIGSNPPSPPPTVGRSANIEQLKRWEPSTKEFRRKQKLNACPESQRFAGSWLRQSKGRSLQRQRDQRRTQSIDR